MPMWLGNARVHRSTEVVLVFVGHGDGDEELRTPAVVTKVGSGAYKSVRVASCSGVSDSRNFPTRTPSGM